MNKNSRKLGFTLIELLLVVAAITIISGISIPIYQSFQNRNDLDIAAESMAHSLRRASLLSQAVDGDSSWGLNIATGTITIFRGASFLGRDSSFDEIFSISSSLIATGTKEYVFSKFEGELSSDFETTFISTNNEKRTISTNTKGRVSY